MACDAETKPFELDQLNCCGRTCFSPLHFPGVGTGIDYASFAMSTDKITFLTNW